GPARAQKLPPPGARNQLWRRSARGVWKPAPVAPPASGARRAQTETPGSTDRIGWTMEGPATPAPEGRTNPPGRCAMPQMPREPEAFAEQVVAMLLRLRPALTVELVGPRELLINGRRLDLENLYRMVNHDPERGVEIVEHYLDQLFTGDAAQLTHVTLDFARPRIMPRIQPEKIFEHLNRELVGHVPFVNGTVVVFVIDLPQMTVSITTE